LAFLLCSHDPESAAYRRKQYLEFPQNVLFIEAGDRLRCWSTEAFLVALFHDINLCAIHCKRVAKVYSKGTCNLPDVNGLTNILALQGNVRIAHNQHLEAVKTSEQKRIAVPSSAARGFELGSARMTKVRTGC
jgi:hypothetical protein